MKWLFKIAARLNAFLHSPMKVFWCCLLFVSVSLLLNGSLLRLYGLHRDEVRLRTQTQQMIGSMAELEAQLRQAQDPAFLERQAMDRYDLADENDLVFVFSDDQ